jgi:hypothetical protein
MRPTPSRATAGGAFCRTGIAFGRASGVLLLASVLGAAPGHATDLAITNVRLYASPGRPPIERATIVIRNGRVERVAAALEAGKAGPRVVTAAGSFAFTGGTPVYLPGITLPELATPAEAGPARGSPRRAARWSRALRVTW